MLRIQKTKVIMKQFFLIAFAFLFCAMEAFSQSFTTRLSNGDKLWFTVTDPVARKVEIVRVKALDRLHESLPSGDLKIPSTVKYKDIVYYVTSIGKEAFCGAESLTSVIIPSSVSNIGEKAFSGCSKLQSIVFPSCNPIICDNAFEKCKSISFISFGSDWTSVDLSCFADADSLREVHIPAKVIKLTGVKQLSHLQVLDVDSNNKAFSSCDGMLYSENGKTLYACPRAKSGEISIMKGTETILYGAFAGCNKVSRILLPESVHEFAFDEFVGCTRLSSIVFLSEMPPITAKWNGSRVFAIKAPNQYCKVYVPKENIARYRTAACNADGLYETLTAAKKTNMVESDMIGKKSIKKIKNQG